MLQALSAVVALHANEDSRRMPTGQDTRGKLEFVSSARDFQSTRPRANRSQHRTRPSPPRVAKEQKPYSNSLGQFLQQRFQSSKPERSSQLADVHGATSSSSLPVSATIPVRNSASVQQTQAGDELVHELAAAIAAASGETPPWLNDISDVAMSDVESGLSNLMNEYVVAHAAEHSAHCDAVRRELRTLRSRLGLAINVDHTPEPDPEPEPESEPEPEPEPEPELHSALLQKLNLLMQTEQLLELKEQVMPGVLQEQQAAKGKVGAKPISALDKLDLGSSQLINEFDLSNDGLIQLYRTLYVFLFGFNSAISSIVGSTLPTLNGPATVNRDTIAILRPRLWRAYFMLVDLMISSCYSRRLEESQVQALGGMAQQITALQRAALSAEAVQVETAASLRAEITKLKTGLTKANRALASKNMELDRLQTREQNLIAAYQALTSSATLRRFELDERLARGQSKNLASVFATEPPRLDETAASQQNLSRILAEEKSKGAVSGPLDFQLDNPQKRAAAT